MDEATINSRRIEAELETLERYLDASEFKSFWEQVREINSLFKTLRPIEPSSRQAHWEELGRLCEQAKARRNTQPQRTRMSCSRGEDSARASYETRVVICRKLGDVRLAEHATTWDQVMSAKNELYECLNMMKSDWSPTGIFNTAGRLNRDDRDYCFDVWKISKEVVDRAFTRIRAEGQARRSAFVDSIVEQIERKRGIITRLEDQIDDLEERISNSTNEGYCSDAQGWIEEKQSIIRDIEHKIEELEDRI
jgi:hypothetical protein